MPAPVQRNDIIDSLNEFAERIADELGFLPDSTTIEAGLDGIEYDDDAIGQEVWHTPNAWNFTDAVCTLPLYEERHFFNTDDTYQVSSPWTVDERKTVILYVDADGDGDYDGNCSGTLVDRDWVLTAAHCLVDNPSAPSSAVQARRVAACSYANTSAAAECVPGSVVQLGPSYLSSPSNLTDFALLKLTGELNAATDLGFRAVSGASESIIEASQVHLDGTPGLIPTSTTHCTDNSHTSPSVTSVLSSAGTYSIGWSYGGRQDHSTGVLFTSHLITTAMDLGQGWSGGGYWYESAAGGDFLVGVHSGFTTIIDWGATSDGENTGPKHDIFRAWVNSTI